MDEKRDQTEEDSDDGVPDEEVQGLMKDHDLDEDTAERVRGVMDELGVDEDDAVEIAENL